MHAAHLLCSVIDALVEPVGFTSSRNCVYAGPRMRTSGNFPSTTRVNRRTKKGQSYVFWPEER